MSNTKISIFILMLSIVYLSAADAGIVKGGLISYWTFDKDTIQKKIVKDIMNNNDATIVGEPKLVEGVIFDALYFGTSDHLEVQSHEGLNMVKGFTIDTWVKGDAAPDNSGAKTTQYFAKGDNYQLNWDHNNETFKSVATRMTGGWLIIAQIQEPLIAQEWYHIAGTWSGRSLKIYLNGKLSKTRNWSGSSELNELPLIIGGPFVGALDEVKLYNRALTDEEVLRNSQDRTQMSVESIAKVPIFWGRIKHE